MGVEKFNLEAGIKSVYVPPGPRDAIADVVANTVAGRIDYMIAPIPLALADIRAGKLRALAVSTRNARPYYLRFRPSQKLESLGSIMRFGTEYGCVLALLPEWWGN